MFELSPFFGALFYCVLIDFIETGFLPAADVNLDVSDFKDMTEPLLWEIPP